MSKYRELFKKEFERYADFPHRSTLKQDPITEGVAPAAAEPIYYPQRGQKSSIKPQRGGATSSWSGGGSSTAIMTMQHALQDLAQDVSRQINLQQIVSENPREQEEAKSRDAFGTFMTKNYMRNSVVPGVEFDPDPKKTQMSQKNPNDPTRISVVMDTMNRIGNPKRGEQFVDGQWGPRTNAAVRDAYAFASGLFNFVDDVNRFATNKMHIQSYNKESLQNLAGMATVDNSLTPEQKSEAAPLVTQHVKAIKNMYDEVKNKVLQHAAYRQFIESDASYKTYEATAPTQQQIDLLKNHFSNGFTVKVGPNNTKISIDNLLSLKSLQDWIATNVPAGIEHVITPEMIVDQIQQQQTHVQTPEEPHQGLLNQYGPGPGF